MNNIGSSLYYVEHNGRYNSVTLARGFNLVKLGYAKKLVRFDGKVIVVK